MSPPARRSASGKRLMLNALRMTWLLVSIATIRVALAETVDPATRDVSRRPEQRPAEQQLDQIKRELIWREYQTDQRGSPMRQFWTAPETLGYSKAPASSKLKRETSIPLDQGTTSGNGNGRRKK